MHTLREYATLEFQDEAPSVHHQRAIQKQLEGKLDIVWLAGGRVQVRSAQWVGVLRLPSGQSVRIVPKLAGNELRVLSMLALVGDLPTGEIQRMRRELDTARDGDGLELLCHLLVGAASRILMAGPIQDYRSTSDDLPYVRGRVNTRRQGLTHFSRVDVLACEFQEFDHDVLENRVLRAALDLVRVLSTNPDLRRRSTILHEDFQSMAPGPLPDIPQLLRELQYDRRNQHYRSAHTWAIALLEGCRIANPFQNVGASTTAFLIDMNRLFEKFVTWLLAQSIATRSLKLTAQNRDGTVLRSGGRRWGSLIPDVLLSDGAISVAIDAKYKRYDIRRIDPGDIYQLMVYAQSYPGFAKVPTALLIYPSEQPASDLRVDLVPTANPIASVVALGIQLPTLIERLVEDRAAALDSVAQRMSAALEVDVNRVHSFN